LPKRVQDVEAIEVHVDRHEGAQLFAVEEVEA